MWLAATSEMYHLAWEASRRPNRAVLGQCGPNFAEITPPVSREFIDQRADIDEPQRGFMVRRADSGWLQGFAWCTTFTHWVHYFRWDSLATPSGLRRPGAAEGRCIDADGALAEALEAQPRQGDPSVSGVVWPTIAEVALVGALGCGSFLLRLLLETLEAEGAYQFVVLQATSNSVGFYERHGFVRVGAVARYSRRRGAGGAAESVGYRHWLATDEELHPSDKPSYMMARPLRQPAPTPSPRGKGALLAQQGRQPAPGSLLARLPSLQPKRLPSIQTAPVPADLLAASAAVDALAEGCIERAQALLEQAGGSLAEPPEPRSEARDGAAPAGAAGKKSRSGARPTKAESARRAAEEALALRKAEKAARAKAAAQRRAAERAAGLPPRPRGRPPKHARPPPLVLLPRAGGGLVAVPESQAAAMRAAAAAAGVPLPPPTPPDEPALAKGAKRARQPPPSQTQHKTAAAAAAGASQRPSKRHRPPPAPGSRAGLRSGEATAMPAAGAVKTRGGGAGVQPVSGSHGKGLWARLGAVAGQWLGAPTS